MQRLRSVGPPKRTHAKWQLAATGLASCEGREGQLHEAQLPSAAAVNASPLTAPFRLRLALPTRSSHSPRWIGRRKVVI